MSLVAALLRWSSVGWKLEAPVFGSSWCPRPSPTSTTWLRGSVAPVTIQQRFLRFALWGVLWRFNVNYVFFSRAVWGRISTLQVDTLCVSHAQTAWIKWLGFCQYSRQKPLPHPAEAFCRQTHPRVLPHSERYRSSALHTLWPTLTLFYFDYKAVLSRPRLWPRHTMLPWNQEDLCLGPNLRSRFSSPSISIRSTHDRHRIDHHFHDKALAELAITGIGVHHAGLQFDDRRAIEDLYLKKILRVIVCTSVWPIGCYFHLSDTDSYEQTLAVGVNLRASHSLVCGQQEAAFIFLQPRIPSLSRASKFSRITPTRNTQTLMLCKC